MGTFVASNYAKICECTIFPKKGVLNLIPCQERTAYNLRCLIKRVRFTKVSPKCADVRHHSPVPKERMRCQISFGVRKTYDLTSVTEGNAESEGATQRTKIDHFRAVPKKRIEGGKTCWTRRRICIRNTRNLAALVQKSA